ncbi:MAG: DUF5060 domain-containing protein [Pirellulaceae bacterium]|jgi:hypothetical protein|nr:DUF5060 domain-containing protein [Pirellulaceae bacterium]
MPPRLKFPPPRRKRQEVELTFTATRDAANHYTDTDAWADFTHDDGTKIRRPMFWDGGRTFRVWFASTKLSGTWHWTTSDRGGDAGLNGKSGTLSTGPAASEPATIFTRHGFWSIPPGGRNLVHADGRARLLCADTAWALPWRATVEQTEIYARDRQAKGFNAALLMTVQPDIEQWDAYRQPTFIPTLPDELRKAGLVGPPLTALVGFLKGACHMSYSTLRKYFRDVLGVAISQGTRSEDGRRWCERIWTVIQTCSQQSRSVCEFLCAAVTAHFRSEEPPSLLPDTS